MFKNRPRKRLRRFKPRPYSDNGTDPFEIDPPFNEDCNDDKHDNFGWFAGYTDNPSGGGTPPGV